MALVDYVNNPNQRTPCILVLDVSGSMTTALRNGRRPIDELNEGLQILENSLKDDPTALTRVQLSIVAVGGPRNDASVLMDWTDCTHFEAFPLTASGLTPMAEGMLIALKLVEEAKENLRQNGISYTRPWIFVISDGEPTSADYLWDQCVSECQAVQQKRHAEIFSIGVTGADMQKLGRLSIRPAIPIEGIKFKELFVWLSASLSAASRSRPGDKIDLPPTDPWRNVGV